MSNIYFTWNGLGDHIVLFGAAYNWYLRTGEKLTIGTSNLVYEKIFSYAKFSDVCSYDKFLPGKQQETLNNLNSNNYNPVFVNASGFKYLAPSYKNNVTTWPSKHLITVICEKLGLYGNVKIEIPLIDVSSKLEIETPLDYVCIMTGGLQNYKAILPSLSQQIIDNYKSKFKFVQIGTLRDAKLENVIDLRGTSLIETINILKKARFLITGTGGLVHLAAACNCKAFVLQTGGEPQILTEYSLHKYVQAVDSCGLCAKNLRDPQHQPCFSYYKCIRNLNFTTVNEELKKQLEYLLSDDIPEPLIQVADSGKKANGLEDYMHQRKTFDNPSQYFN